MNKHLSRVLHILFALLQLRYYAQKSSDLEDLEAKVVAAEKRKQYHRSESVGIFFSLVIGLPFAVLVLVWISVRGAFPYIRILLNDPENFPSVAALYWIGQTFTLFVIVMDLHALSENSAVDVNNSLSSYQLVFLWFITVVEIIGLLINLLLALVPLISHAKNVAFKSFFECYSKLYLIILLLSFKYIGRKEARIWLFLSSLVVPIIALSSHAGFIIGGWVSYEDRSVAILLLYLFVFIFLYWSLQNIYRFSTFAVNYLKVTIIYGDNILRIGGIAYFARIKFCAYAACASGVALLFHAHARALVRQWYAHKNTAVYTRCAYFARSERAHGI